MEQHRNYTIILTKEGTFQKVRPIKNAEIGMEVPFKPVKLRKGLSNSAAKKRKLPASIFAVACIFLLLFIPFTLITGNNQPYAYVAIDINPSIELEVTNELTVQSVRPINKDATVILNQLTDLEDKNIAIAIDMIIEKSEEHGMINNAKHMLVGVSYSDEDSNEQRIREGIEQYQKNKSDWDIASFHVPEDMREEAMDLDTSMNEIMAENLDDGNDLSTNLEELDDKEKAIINSFYNNNHSEKEVHPPSNEEKSVTEDETEVEEPVADTEKEVTEDDPSERKQPDERKSEQEKIKTEEHRNEQQHNKDPGPNIKEDEEHRHKAIPSDKQEPNNRPHANDNEGNPEENNKEQENAEIDGDNGQGDNNRNHGNDPLNKDNEN